MAYIDQEAAAAALEKVAESFEQIAGKSHEQAETLRSAAEYIRSFPPAEFLDEILIRWRPIKYRPMNDDEIKIYSEEYDEANVYDCELPDDGQEVLITTSWGTVEKTTFVRDHRNDCYFEDYEDETEVIAWMPAPERYKAEREETEERR